MSESHSYLITPPCSIYTKRARVRIASRACVGKFMTRENSVCYTARKAHYIICSPARDL